MAKAAPTFIFAFLFVSPVGAASSPMDPDTSMMQLTALELDVGHYVGDVGAYDASVRDFDVHADNGTAVVRAAMERTPVYSCDFVADGSDVGLDGYDICQLNNDIDVGNDLATGAAWCAAAGGYLFGNYASGVTCGGLVLAPLNGGEMYLTPWARRGGRHLLFAGNNHGNCGNDQNMYIGRQCGWSGYPNPCDCDSAPCHVACARVSEASGKGDPHLTNVLGQHFDLYLPGFHALLQVPRGAKPPEALLLVNADARRLGAACADVYFQAVVISGAWANQSGTLHFSATSDGTPRGMKWTRFGTVDLKVVPGRTLGGVEYLNVLAKHLDRTGYRVGGLLGEDDHSDESTPDPACARAASLRAA